jgi:hypothetical protein
MRMPSSRGVPEEVRDGVHDDFMTDDERCAAGFRAATARGSGGAIAWLDEWKQANMTEMIHGS